MPLIQLLSLTAENGGAKLYDRTVLLRSEELIPAITVGRKGIGEGQNALAGLDGEGCGAAFLVPVITTVLLLLLSSREGAVEGYGVGACLGERHLRLGLIPYHIRVLKRTALMAEAPFIVHFIVLQTIHLKAESRRDRCRTVEGGERVALLPRVRLGREDGPDGGIGLQRAMNGKKECYKKQSRRLAHICF